MDDQVTPGHMQRVAYRLNQNRWWLWLGIAILYLLSFNTHWRITPDSANYLIVAKAFAGEGRLHHPFGVEYFIGPGFSIVMGYLIRVFGSEAFWVFNLAMLALVPLNLALIYWLVRLHTDRSRAVVVALLASVTHLFFSYAFYILADWPFVTGVLTYLVGVGYLEKHSERWWAWGSLMLLGLLVTASLRSVFVVLPLATVLGLSIRWLSKGEYARFVKLGAGVAAVCVVGLLVVPWSTFEWMRGDVRLLTESMIYQLPQTMSQLIREGLWSFFGEEFS